MFTNRANRIHLHLQKIFLLQCLYLYYYLLLLHRFSSLALKDQDGNLLSTGYLNQRTGSMIVNIGSYTVARLNPNENIITEPIKLLVPESAPYRVIIEAVIENTYYHYGKPDQVIAPGMSQSIETTISETAYRAFASPEHTFYPYAQPVLITGSAISNNSPLEKGGEGGYVPVPYVPVKIGISVKGFDRFYTVTTDSQGNFSYAFIPGSNEAGTYSLWAVHPDVTTRTIQSSFTIAGLSMSPETATVRMARNRSIDIPVSLYNYGGGTLTGLTFETQTGTDITAGVINNGDNILTAGESQNITFRLTSSTSAPDTTYATMKAFVNEGLQKTLNANISMVQLIPVITTSPSYIDTGMVRGNQKIATFTITNTGEETLRNARIEGPSTLWMTLTNNRAIGDIKPGTSTSIGIMFNPPATLAQGVYDDRIVIYSDNHIPYTYHIQVTVTSNAVGNVLFDVLNEFMEDVPGATITLQHQLLTELIYTLKTAADGTVMLYDIPEGRYTYNVSPPPGHMPYSGTFTIQAGLTTTVPIALEMTMVTVSWSVTPTVIQDKYEIVVTQTFETNVPAPVLVVEPPNINLPALQPGQVFNGEFKVTNYGLIEVYDVLLDFPRSIDDYDIEVMTSAIPNKIGAMKSITVPYRVTRRITTASLIKSLFEEITGYGGGNCVKNFNITIKAKCVICPNTAAARIVEKIANYLVSIFYDCPSTITPSTPSVYTGGGGSVYVLQPTSGQSGSGNIAGSSPTPIQTSNPCNCKEEGTILPDSDAYDCQKQACVQGNPSTIPDNGEKPLELCKICDNGHPTNMPDGSRARIVDTLCCYNGDITPNNPVTFIEKCPNKVPKNPPYESPVNGCGPQDSTDIVPSRPMLYLHLSDSLYLSLHGVPDENGHFDGDFITPCDYHDICYGTCNGQQGDSVIPDGVYKNQCDKKIGEDIDAVCYQDFDGPLDALYLGECLIYARIYERAVKYFGTKAFKNGQADSCNCCY